MKLTNIILITAILITACSNPEPSSTCEYVEALKSQKLESPEITFCIFDKSVSFGADTISKTKKVLYDFLWPRLTKSKDIVAISIASENSLNPNNIVIKEIQTSLPKLTGLSELKQKQLLLLYNKNFIDEKNRILNEIEQDLLNIEATQTQTEIAECLTHVHTILKRYPDSKMKLMALTDARQVSERFYLGARNHNEAKKLAKSHSQVLINELGVEPIFDRIQQVQFILPQDSILTKNETGNFSKIYWQGIFSELGYQNEVILTTKNI